MEGKDIQRSIETIRGARPEEILTVAVKLAVLVIRSKSGSKYPQEICERAALQLLESYIDYIRNGQDPDNPLADWDHAKMAIN